MSDDDIEAGLVMRLVLKHESQRFSQRHRNEIVLEDFSVQMRQKQVRSLSNKHV